MTACFSGRVAYPLRRDEVRAGMRPVAERPGGQDRAAAGCARPRTGSRRRRAPSASRPATGYVAKLGLRCSPSVTTGEPVASNSAIGGAHRLIEECSELGLGDTALGGFLHDRQELGRPRDAPDRLGRDSHTATLTHGRRAVNSPLQECFNSSGVTGERWAS